MEYVGADVDINNVVCSVMSTHEKLKETFVVPSNPEGMDQLIEKMGNPRKWKILFESSTYSTDLHIYLAGKGIQSVTANAYNLRLINESKKKTDTNHRIVHKQGKKSGFPIINRHRRCRLFRRSPSTGLSDTSMSERPVDFLLQT